MSFRKRKRPEAGTDATPAPPGKAGSPAGSVLKLVVGIVFVASMAGFFDGAWVGVLVGSVFLLLGLFVVFTFFGPYSGNPWASLFQAPGRLLLGAVMIFLGGVALVSALSDIRPALVWEYPNFGELRTLFWDRDDYRAMACDKVEDGPAAALLFALERSGPSRIECPQPDGSTASLLDRVLEQDLLLALLDAHRYDQGDLDRRLNAAARSGPEQRLEVERLVAAGANPNAEIDNATAVWAAMLNYNPQIALWLLENGAQANHTFENGDTLLERAIDSDRPDMAPLYEKMLREHGAADSPKLEQTPMGRSRG